MLPGHPNTNQAPIPSINLQIYTPTKAGHYSQIRKPKVQKPQKYKDNMGTIRNHHCRSERTKLTHTRMCQPGVRKSQGQVYSSPTDQQSKWDKCDQVKNENFSVRSQ